MKNFYLIDQIHQIFKIIALSLGVGVSAVACAESTPQILQSTANPVEDHSQMNGISDAGTIIASRAAIQRPITPDLMCFNVNSLRVPAWNNTQFTQAVKNLGPRVLRIPGGTVANYWNWQRGGLITNDRGLPGRLPQFLRYPRSRRYTGGKLEDFQAGLAATGTTPIFVLNMLTSDLASQLQMLRKARSLNIPIKYIELGNEFYFNSKNDVTVFPTPKDYAVTASAWTRQIKQEFPDAEIGIIGAVPREDETNNRRKENWNQSLLSEALPKANAITLHFYRAPGFDQSQTSATTYPFFSEEDVPTILGTPFKSWQALLTDPAFQVIPQDKKIWVTEYSLFEPAILPEQGQKKPTLSNSWVQGLYTMSMSLLFLEEPRIEMMCNHELIGSPLFASIIIDAPNHSSRAEDLSSNPLKLSANGLGLQLLSQVTQNMNVAQKIEFSSNPINRADSKFTYPALYGWFFMNDSTQQALILNLSKNEFKVDFRKVIPKTMTYETISGDPRTIVEQEESLQKEQGTVLGNVVLPAYSITKLSHQK
jgi:hypothetical protein